MPSSSFNYLGWVAYYHLSVMYVLCDYCPSSYQASLTHLYVWQNDCTETYLSSVSNLRRSTDNSSSRNKAVCPDSCVVANVDKIVDFCVVPDNSVR